MRSGALLAVLRAPDLENDDGLASLSCPAGDLEELGPGVESLDHRTDHPDSIVVEHVVDEVGDIEVGLVARRAPEAHSEPAIHPLHERPADASALGDQADRTAGHVFAGHRRHAQQHAIGDVGETRRVGAVDAHAMDTCGSDHSVLHCPTLRPCL